MRKRPRILGLAILGWAAMALWGVPTWAMGGSSNCAMCLPALICINFDTCWDQDVCRPFQIGGYAECRWSFLFCSESPYNYCVLASLGNEVPKSQNWPAWEPPLRDTSVILESSVSGASLRVGCS